MMVMESKALIKLGLMAILAFPTAASAAVRATVMPLVNASTV